MSRTAHLFRTVVSRRGNSTHLVVMSPAIPGSRPDQLPTSTLCGSPVWAADLSEAHEVQCLRCLFRAPTYMGMPSWEAHL